MYLRSLEAPVNLYLCPMEWTMRALSMGKLLRALLAVGVAWTIFASNALFGQYVIEDTSCIDLESRVRALEAGRIGCPESCTPLTANLATDGRPGLIAWADFLYWTVRNTGFEYGITAPGPEDGGPVGRVERLGGSYNPAFRVGLGRRFGDDCVGAGPEIYMTYTRFSNDITRTTGPGRSTIISSDNAINTDADMDNGILVFPENVTPEDLYASAIGTYRFRYHSGDLFIGQNLIMTDNLTLRLQGGARYMQMNELKQVTYNGGDFLAPLTATHNGEFDGAGLIVGSMMRWNLLPSVRFNIGINAGTLIGSNRTRTIIPDSPDASLFPIHILTTPTDVSARETRLIPVVELMAGLDFRKQIGRNIWTTSVGYDFTNYFNLSDTRVFSDAFQEGQNSHILNAITLDGLYARFGINY